MSLSNNFLIDNFPSSSTLNWNPISGNWIIINGEYQTNGILEAITQASNFSAKDIVFECDLKLGLTGDAGISIRSTTGNNGYFITFRPGNNDIQVYDLPNLLAYANNAGIAANDWKHIRIIMSGNNLLVYYDDMNIPKIKLNDNIYTGSGGLFLRSWENQTSYRMVKMYELNNFFSDTNDKQLLTKWIPYKGEMFDIISERIYASGGTHLSIANMDNIDDFILDAGIRFDSNDGCGFMLRTNDATLEDGYYVDFSPANSRIYIYELYGGNGVVNPEAINITISKYEFHHVRIICYKEDILVYFDNMLTPIITATCTTVLSGRIGIRSYGAECYFDNFTIKEFDPIHVVKTYVLCYNPTFSQSVIPSEAKGKKFIEYYQFNDPKRISYDYITSIMEATDFKVYYRIINWADVNAFPPFTNNWITEQKYLDDFPKDGNTQNQNDYWFDYQEIINSADLINLVNSHEIDEVWTWFEGRPSAFSEAAMVGEDTFDINGIEIPIMGARRFAIMGMDYYFIDSSPHPFNHRIDKTMSHYYGRNIYNDYPNPISLPIDYSVLNNLEKLILSYGNLGYEVINNSAAIIGIGSTHLPPQNSRLEYEQWDINRFVLSNFAYWKNFGNIHYNINTTDVINCDTWVVDPNLKEVAFQRFWLSCIPKALDAGVDEFGIDKDWWKYILLEVN